MVGYDGGNVKENIPIGTELTAIDLPDDKPFSFGKTKQQYREKTQPHYSLKPRCSTMVPILKGQKM